MITLTFDEIVSHDTLTSEERENINKYMKTPNCDKKVILKEENSKNE